jgi:ankyrin repeat protein
MKNTLISRKAQFVKLSFAILALLLLMLDSGAKSFANDLEKNLNDAIVNNQAAEVARILKSGGTKLREAVRSNATHYVRHVSRYGTAEIVRQVLEGCALTSEKPALDDALVEAADNSSFAEVIPLLLTYGADPNREYHMNFVLNRVIMLYSGNPAKSGQLLATIKTLLAKGTYIDSFDESMETPLMIACRREDLAVVRLLIDSGANPALTNKDMTSAMSYAPAGSAVAKELTRKSIDVKVAGKGEPSPGSPTTPDSNIFNMPADEFNRHTQSMSFDNYMSELMQLSAAVSSGDADTVKELLGKGLDANSVIDDTGITMLMQDANH